MLGLWARLFLLAVVLGAFMIYWGLYSAARDHRARLAAGCVHTRAPRGVLRVEVKRHDYLYLQARGYPRVMRVGGDRLLGDRLAYDHGREAMRVKARLRRVCHGQRYRLAPYRRRGRGG